LAGLMAVQVRPLGGVVSDRLTVPLNPFAAMIVIVEEMEEPTFPAV
jgi:hypothetical protein